VWIKTKIGVDLRNSPYSEEQYQNLLRALHNEPPKAPPIGPKPVFKDSSPVEQSSASTALAPLQFFNFDGSRGPIYVLGRKHSAQDSSLVDLWCLVTIVNYTQYPMKIAPRQLFLSGAEWPLNSQPNPCYFGLACLSYFDVSPSSAVAPVKKRV
jgi:hypothetical protein